MARIGGRVKLLAILALAAQLSANSPLEEKLFETRLDCIMEMKNLDPSQVDEVMYWFYLAGKVDQIDDTLEIMGYYDEE